MNSKKIYLCSVRLERNVQKYTIVIIRKKKYNANVI